MPPPRPEPLSQSASDAYAQRIVPEPSTSRDPTSATGGLAYARLLPGALSRNIQVGSQSPLPKNQLTLILLPLGGIPLAQFLGILRASEWHASRNHFHQSPRGQRRPCRTGTKQNTNFYYRSQRHAWLPGLAAGYMSKRCHGPNQGRAPSTGPGDR